MIEATITEVAVMDLPGNLISGTAQKRRKLVAIRYTSAATNDTITIATYISQSADVEGLLYDTWEDAVSATSITWSTTTLTCAAGVGDGEVGVIINIT